MQRIAPAGDVYQAGTLSRQPAGGRGGPGDAREARRSRVRPPGALTDRLASGLREAAGDLPVSIVSVPGLVTPFFAEEPPRDFAGASACDLDAYGRFARGLLDRGIYPPASQFEAWFVSLAHDEAAIERTVRRRGRGVRRSARLNLAGCS